MTPLEAALEKELEWRVKEISSIRSILLKRKLPKYQNEIILKYSPVAFYSLWEGFVVCSLGQYICEVNKLNISYNSLHPSVVTHDIDIKFLKDKYMKEKSLTDFKDVIMLIGDLHNYLSNPITIGMKIPTKSNVNFERINTILDRLNIPPMSKKHKTPLDHLKRVRDDAAHGEFSIQINLDMTQELCFIAINGMTDLAINISDAYNYQFYLR